MYDNIDASALAFTGFFTFLGLGILIAIVYACLCSKSRSKEYRELMTDMYVVGMIKKFAAEDKIDLIAELKEYAKIQKKSKLRLKGLDQAIEEELKEKIAKVQDEKEDKK